MDNLILFAMIISIISLFLGIVGFLYVLIRDVEKIEIQPPTTN